MNKSWRTANVKFLNQETKYKLGNIAGSKISFPTSDY